MNSEVAVNVTLEAIGNMPPPASGAVRFSYALDDTVSDKYVGVKTNGDIFVGDANNKITTIAFVLKSKTLKWGDVYYDASLTSNSNGPSGAENVLYVSTTLGKSPTGPWPSDQNLFRDFKFPSNTNNPSREAVQVTFDRNSPSQKDFQYSLAVNLKSSLDGHVVSVRDDPLIRDRGVPNVYYVNPYLVAFAGLVLGALIVHFGLKLRRRMADPR